MLVGEVLRQLVGKVPVAGGRASDHSVRRLARSCVVVSEHHRVMSELTAEQLSVVECAAPPGRGAPCVVMCAAGTGKTTTLVAVAGALLNQGHGSVHYAVFNRAAMAEAKERMPGGVLVGTLHSFARQLVGARAESGSGTMAARDA